MFCVVLATETGTQDEIGQIHDNSPFCGDTSSPIILSLSLDLYHQFKSHSRLNKWLEYILKAKNFRQLQTKNISGTISKSPNFISKKI